MKIVKIPSSEKLKPFQPGTVIKMKEAATQNESKIVPFKSRAGE